MYEFVHNLNWTHIRRRLSENKKEGESSGYDTPSFWLLFLFLLLLLFDAEEIAEAVEVFLHDETETLRVQTVARKIAVVGLIVHAYGEVAVREDEVAEVKITDETLRGIRIVAITELAIEE